MHIRKNSFGFTLLEILMASAITVAVVVLAAVGLNTLLDHKKTENAESKLAFEAFQILEEIEKNLENKSVALGNLLINENNHPFQFRVNGPVTGYPSLNFFVYFAQGPRALCYSLAPLPSIINDDSTVMTGLFKLLLNTNASAAITQDFSSVESFANIGNIANMMSDSVVSFEVHLIKLDADGVSLEYLNEDAKEIKMYGGQWTVGEEEAQHQDVKFIEIEVGLLPRSLHATYFQITSDADRIGFLNRNGFRLSRIMPWRI
ncbi:MAG: hypothetical protein LBS71_02900 [Puniceicoccales bacterium]|jgi:hypothetical protein|nr:hypothetical protein [Puniceicoccales bacterium]